MSGRACPFSTCAESVRVAGIQGPRVRGPFGKHADRAHVSGRSPFAGERARLPFSRGVLAKIAALSTPFGRHDVSGWAYHLGGMCAALAGARERMC